MFYVLEDQHVLHVAAVEICVKGQENTPWEQPAVGWEGMSGQPTETLITC